MTQSSRKEWTRSTRAHDVSCDLLHAHLIDYRYDRHIHCGYAIGVVTHGMESFWCEGKVHHAPAGSIVTVNPYEVHDGSSGAKGGFIYRMFYFSPEEYARVLSEIGDNDLRAPSFSKPVFNDSRLNRRLITLHQVLQSEPDLLLRQEMWMETLAALAHRHACFPSCADHNHYRAATPGLLRVLDYLHENLSEVITLKDLARTANLSSFQTLRRFKDCFGIPPHRYLTNLRLFKAQDLLAKGLPLAEVAVACGFADQAHLTRWYKRIYGITPGKYAIACNNVQYRNCQGP